MILWQSTRKLLHSTWLQIEATHVRSSWRYIFQLMEAPLVENCMTCLHFHFCLWTYGMWERLVRCGVQPTHCWIECISIYQQCLTPRVFERIFAWINKNEQITDLLDPSQRNTQGLSNRTSATSINAESSGSHTIFTCVLELC